MGLLLGIIYLSFISLGLPDAVLGAAWPNMYPEFQVSVSYAGIISMIISAGTILSSINSDRLIRKFGTGIVTAVSIGITAIALWGFSISHSFLMICIWAVPYGIGAGSVDVALNNYVVLHYASNHMSWLRCMWGIGITIGPYIMGMALTNGATWNIGYRMISIIQVMLTVALILSLPKWKNKKISERKQINKKRLSLKEILKISRVKTAMICFCCYCGIEQTIMLWMSSYLNLTKEVAVHTAAMLSGIFCMGITAGCGINGFIAMRLKDNQMIRIGQVMIAIGITIILFSVQSRFLFLGLLLLGLGCAPVYPSMIHLTPEYFGIEHSQAIIGVQMASAYSGTCFIPLLFGWISKYIAIQLLPMYLLILLVIMIYMNERLSRNVDYISSSQIIYKK